MRSFVTTTLLLVVTTGLSGCGQAPADSLSQQRMLSPEELEQLKQDQETVVESERAQQARIPIRHR